MSVLSSEKQDGRDEGIAGNIFLFGDQRIEASDGVGCEPGHGAAAVEDKDDLCKIFVHVHCLLAY